MIAAEVANPSASNPIPWTVYTCDMPNPVAFPLSALHNSRTSALALWPQWAEKP